MPPSVPESTEVRNPRTNLRVAVATAIGLAVIGFVAIMGWGLSNKESVTGLSGATRIGRPAPQFVLKLFDGAEVELSQFDGPVVVNFWASWCAPCREEALGLERTFQRFREDSVGFIGVDVQDSEESAIAYLQEFDVTYPNGMDTDGTITVDYGVVGLPVTFFIGTNGIIERRWVGSIPESQIVAWVRELLTNIPGSSRNEGSKSDRTNPIQ